MAADERTRGGGPHGFVSLFYSWHMLGLLQEKFRAPRLRQVGMSYQ
jgi:hypothetical protein